MTTPPIILKLRDQLQRGALGGITITHRVAGGAPGERREEEELVLSGPDLVQAKVRWLERGALTTPVARALAPAETHELVRRLADDGAELFTRQTARFLPDSLVGSVTIEIGGEKETLFYLADEEERKDQQKTVSPRAAKTFGDFTALARRLRRP